MVHVLAWSRLCLVFSFVALHLGYNYGFSKVAKSDIESKAMKNENNNEKKHTHLIRMACYSLMEFVQQYGKKKNKIKQNKSRKNMAINQNLWHTKPCTNWQQIFFRLFLDTLTHTHAAIYIVFWIIAHHKSQFAKHPLCATAAVQML